MSDLRIDHRVIKYFFDIPGSSGCISGISSPQGWLDKNNMGDVGFIGQFNIKYSKEDLDISHLSKSKIAYYLLLIFPLVNFCMDMRYKPDEHFISNQT